MRIRRISGVRAVISVVGAAAVVLSGLVGLAPATAATTGPACPQTMGQGKVPLTGTALRGSSEADAGALVFGLPLDFMSAGSGMKGLVCAVAGSDGRFSMSLAESSAGWIVFTRSSNPGTKASASQIVAAGSSTLPAVTLMLTATNYTVSPQRVEAKTATPISSGFGLVCLASVDVVKKSATPTACSPMSPNDGEGKPWTSRFTVTGSDQRMVFGFHIDPTTQAVAMSSTSQPTWVSDATVSAGAVTVSLDLTADTGSGGGNGGGGGADYCAMVSADPTRTAEGSRSGRVTGADGSAVAGAVVVSFATGAEGPDPSSFGCTLTDSNGDYTVDIFAGKQASGGPRYLTVSPPAGSTLGSALRNVSRVFPAYDIQLSTANATVRPTIGEAAVNGLGIAFIGDSNSMIVAAAVGGLYDSSWPGIDFKFSLAQGLSEPLGVGVVAFGEFGMQLGMAADLSFAQLTGGTIIVPLSQDNGGGNGAPTTNCDKGQSPILTGTVLAPDGKPMRADVTVQPVFGMGQDGSGFGWMNSGDDGVFTYCWSATGTTKGSDSPQPLSFTVSIAPAQDQTGGLQREDFWPTVRSISATCISQACQEEFATSGDTQAGGAVTIDGLPAMATWSLARDTELCQGDCYDGTGLKSATTKTGNWGVNGLAPGRYRATFTPTDPGYSPGQVDFVVARGGAVTYSTTSGNGNVFLRGANVRGVLHLIDGVTVAKWTQVRLESLTGECSPNNSGSTGISPSCSTQTNEAGEFSLTVGDGTYTLYAARPFGDTTSADSTYTLVVSGSTLTIDGTVVPSLPFSLSLKGANFRGTLYLADGVTGARYTSLQIQSTAPECASAGQKGGSTTQGGSCNTWGYTNDQGGFALTVPDGTYTLRAYRPWGENSSTDTTWDLVVSGSSVTIDGLPATPPITLVLDGPNLTFAVTSGGETAGRAWINLVPWADAATHPEGRADWNWRSGFGTSTNNSGIAGLQVTNSGAYRLTVSSSDGTFGQYELTVFITVTDSDVTVETCPKTFDFQVGPCVLGDRIPVTETEPGVFAIGIPSANLVFRICDNPVDSCTPLAFAGVDVQQRKTDMGGWSYWQSVMWSNSTQTGLVKLSVEQSGDYRLSLKAPWGGSGSYADTAVTVRVTIVGGTTEVRRCTGSMSNPCETTAEAYVADPSGILWDQRFATPNVTGTVLTASEVPLAWQWIEFSQSCGDGCRSYVGGTSTNATGQFAASLPAGSYIATVRPQSWSSDGSSVTDLAFVVTESGLTVAGIPVETLAIKMRGANVSGTVFEPGGSRPARDAGIQIERKTGDQWWWAAWLKTGPTGGFGVRLDAGTYRARIDPGQGTVGASPVVVEFVVTGADDPTLTSVGVPGSLVDGKLIVSFPQPNVSGTVSTATGVARGAYIGIEKWEDRYQQYQWTNEVAGTASNWLDGSFGLSIPAGRWRLQVNPPWPNNDNLAPTMVAILVQADGSVCRWSSVVAGVCADGSTIAPGDFDIEFGLPNYRGTATAGGSSMAGSWMWIEKRMDWGGWNGSGLWSTISESGGFGVTFTEAGVYRVNVNPSWQISGYSKGTAYVRVEASGDSVVLCEQTLAQVDAEMACASPVPALDAVSIPLPGANLVGVVQDGAGSGIRDSWIEVTRTSARGWEWIEGSPTKSEGAFAIRISEAGAYDLRVNPPWGNAAGLTRKTVPIVMGAFDGDEALDVCLAADYDANAGTCSAVRDTLTITLSAGNVTGTLKEPTGTAVAYSFVSVERWASAAWMPNGEYMWQWTDLGANTTGTGTFGLDLADGTYRVTGMPSWNNEGGYAKASVVVTVTGGSWCVQSETANRGDASTFGACEQPSDGSLDIVLASANVVGTLLASEGGAAVRDAYVSLSREVTFNDPGSGNSWVNYEYQGGMATNGSGRFSLQLSESGTYRLEFNPPWQGTGSELSRFHVTLTATCSGGTCTYAADGYPGTFGSDSPMVVAFPSPNLSGRVCSAGSTGGSCTGVANTWVNVEEINLSGGTLRWAGGDGTRKGGYYRMTLGEGRYRLTAYPSWENPDGLPQQAIVTVDALGAATCESGCYTESGSLDIRLGSANVTGRVVYQASGTATPMPYAWIEVLQAGTWLKGAPVDSSGDFALSLDPGEYQLRAYPNWGVAARQPVTIDLQVKTGDCDDTCWRYHQEGSYASTVGSPLVVDFDHVTPNVTLTILAAADHAVTGKRTVLVDVKNLGDLGDPGDDTYSLVKELTGKSSGGSPNTLKVALPPGTYRFRVVGALGETLTANVSDDVVIVDSSPVSAEVTPIATGS